MIQILLDNGIFSHAEFAQNCTKQTSVHWGEIDQVLPISGLVRKKPDQNIEYQNQKEALFTVGRLIREGRIKAYDYIEIQFEKMRGRAKIPEFNALQGCDIFTCPAALERSRFRQTADFTNFISKGGKKDHKAGNDHGEASQIAFLEWLNNLKTEHVNVLVENANHIGLTDVEVKNLREISWFQFLCQRSGSSENYLDVFHLWTAKSNGFDALLTLDKELLNLVTRVKNEKALKTEIRTEVLQPLDLLQKLGISEPDPVPIEAERFYHWHEVQ